MAHFAGLVMELPNNDVALTAHIPVLADQVLNGLDPQPGQVLVDGTVGAGGHASRIAQRIGPTGWLIGFDQDASMLAKAQPRIQGCRVTLVHRNFDQLRRVLDELNIARVDAVLADVGFASDQMESAERGFSFLRDGPLDMRLDQASGRPASDIIARWDERQLADLFWEYGEERHSRRVARRIVETRKQCPIQTTLQLAELVRRCVPRPKGRGPRIDPATRVFQALRIEVNDELGSLERLLEQLPVCLPTGGRAAIISFHSLEDRRVKQTFRNKEVWEELTRKPIVATEAEQRNNPRSRSAKLRIAKLRVKWEDLG